MSAGTSDLTAKLKARSFRKPQSQSFQPNDPVRVQEVFAQAGLKMQAQKSR